MRYWLFPPAWLTAAALMAAALPPARGAETPPAPWSIREGGAGPAAPTLADFDSATPRPAAAPLSPTRPPTDGLAPPPRAPLAILGGDGAMPSAFLGGSSVPPLPLPPLDGEVPPPTFPGPGAAPGPTRGAASPAADTYRPPAPVLPEVVAPAGGGGGAASLPAVVVELDGSASYDPDGDPVTFHWKQVEGPRVVLSDPAAPKPTFKVDREGVYVFELVVSNGAMRSAPQLVEVSIEPENRPPVARLALEEVTVETGGVVRLDARSSSDPDDDNLSFAWRQTDGLPLDEQLSRARTLASPVLEFPAGTRTGVYELTVAVSDGEATSERTARLIVRPPRQPPVAVIRAPTHAPSGGAPAPAAPPAPVASVVSAPAPAPRNVEARRPAAPVARIAGQRHVRLGAPANLDGRRSAPSPAGGRLAYEWTQKAGPFVRAVVENDPEGTLSFTPREAGDYHWELVVADADASDAPRSAPARFVVTATDSGQPPVAGVRALRESVMIGQEAILDGQASRDPDGGADLEYRWRQVAGPKVNYAPGGGNPAVLRFQPEIPGDYGFELVVAAGGVPSAPATANVTATAPNRPPVIAIQVPARVVAGESFELHGSASDPDNDPVEVQWRQIQGPRPTLLARPAKASRVELTPATPGDYIFSFEATDNINPFIARRAAVKVEAGM